MSTPNALQGAIQSSGTCWFYSIINGFLLTDYGQKILYIGMKQLYDSLPAARKEYMLGTTVTCPGGGSVAKPIEFFKFVNHYLGYLGSRGTPSRVKLGRSANLLNIAKRRYKLEGGLKGGWPYQNIIPMLNHYGFKNSYINISPTEEIVKRVKRGTLFVVASWASGSIKAKDLNTAIQITKKDSGSQYSLMCTSIVFGNTTIPNNKNKNNKVTHRLHAITGFRTGNKMYVFDSNQSKIFKCNWRDIDELKLFIQKDIVPHYGSLFTGFDPFQTLRFEYLIFARKSALDHVNTSIPLANKPVHLSGNQVINMINKAYRNEPNAEKKLKTAKTVFNKHRLTLPIREVTRVRTFLKNMTALKRARSGSAARTGSAARSGSAKKTRTITVKLGGKTVNTLRG
jgi:hypothetical protein